MSNTVIYIGRKTMYDVALLNLCSMMDTIILTHIPGSLSLARVFWYWINLGWALFLINSDVSSCSGMQGVWLGLQITIRTGALKVMRHHIRANQICSEYMDSSVWLYNTAIFSLTINNLKTTMKSLHMMAISYLYDTGILQVFEIQMCELQCPRHGMDE